MRTRDPIHREELCCGYKRCAVVSLHEDGSVELSDDDPEAGSVGRIKLRPASAKRLAELILGHGE